MFADSLSLIDQAGLTHLHVFPYSARPGTPGGPGCRRSRARRASAAPPRCARPAPARLDALLASRLGALERVLVESGRIGRTEQFARLRLDRPAPPGAIVAAVVTGHGGGALDGRLRA